MDRIIRVDAGTGQVSEEKCPEKYSMLGGRSLTSRVVSDEISPKCDPLGPENKLIAAPGVLSGTAAACSGRMSFGGKSPLTGTIKESNVGGTASQKLARNNVKAISVEGAPKDDTFKVLVVKKDSAELVDAGDLTGKGTYETVSKLQAQYNKAGKISIGPAGEENMTNAGNSGSDQEGR